MTGAPQDPTPSEPSRYEPYQPPAGPGPQDPYASPGWSPDPYGPSSSTTPGQPGYGQPYPSQSPSEPYPGPSTYGPGPGQPVYGSNPYEQPVGAYSPNPYEQPAGAAYGYGQPQHGPGWTGDPLMQPLYGAGFGQAVGRFFRKYVVFRGRASRSEYLWAVLFTTLVLVALYAVGIPVIAMSDAGSSTADVLSPLYGLLFLVVVLGLVLPSIAVGVRRLHDAGYSGALYLLSFIPYLGGLVVFILCCQPTSPNASRFDA